MNPFQKTVFAAPRTNGSPQPSLAPKPPSAFPGRIAGDADLTIAVNRFQTSLGATLDSVSLTMTVTNASQIVANMQLSIDSEIVKVTALPTGNSVPISRAFDGTSAAVHLSGAIVSGFIDAWHHNALVSEVEAIETALGVNLSNLGANVFVINTPFIFPAQSPGGSLIAGANQITLSPVPAGVNGTDTGHSVYISGGTGTAEAALIIGGTAVAGAPSGTLIIQCANTHSGAWTIQSATGGIQEAICSLPAAGGQVWVVVNVTLYANVTGAGKTNPQVRKMAGITISGAFTILNAPVPGAGEQVFSQPPDWTTVATNDSLRCVIGNFPESGEFGFGTAPVVQSIVGAIAVPANASSSVFASAVSGYASSAKSATGAVAVSGLANAAANGSSIWGANFVVGNYDQTTTYTGSNLCGIEVDVNSRTTAPNNVRGIEITGGSTIKATGSNRALSVRPMGVYATPVVTWDYALYSEAGAANTGIHLDALSTSNNSGSQPIELISINSSGISHAVVIVSDATGNLILRSGQTGGGLVIEDGTGAISAGFNTGGQYTLTTLPSTPPAAGSKQLWYDPADSNRVKFVP